MMGAETQLDLVPASSEFPFVPTIRSGCCSEKGPRRYMEDEYVCIDDLRTHLPTLLPSPASLYAVFDGHGGPHASSFLKDNFTRLFFQQSPFLRSHDFSLPHLQDCFRTAFLLADLALADVTTSSGTTALAALLLGRLLLVANAGDCRAVLCRKGVAIDMSQDHKPTCPSENRRLQQSGGYVEDGYLNGVLSVSRALGDWHMKLPMGSSSPLIAEPDLRHILLTEDDEFLIIACDGIWDVMSSQQAVNSVRRRLRSRHDPHQCADYLVKEALSLNTFDNLTVLVVCFSSPDYQQQRPPRLSFNISSQDLAKLQNLIDTNAHC